MTTFLTFLRIRGRNQILSHNDRFARLAIASRSCVLRILESGGNDFSAVKPSPIDSFLASWDVVGATPSMTVPFKHVDGRVRSRRLASCTWLYVKDASFPACQNMT